MSLPAAAFLMKMDDQAAPFGDDELHRLAQLVDARNERAFAPLG